MVLPFLAAIAPFAPLIGGAIGAVGQLMAPKPKASAGSIDLKGLRRDAEEAGFNPLTIIRGGGLAGYGVTPAGPDMRLSNALSTFGSGMAQWSYDPYGEAKSRAELRLANAQIASYARASRAPGNLSLGGTPKATGGGTDWTAFGIDFKANPWFSDAQVAEDRHGDIVSAVWGAGTVVGDVAYTAGLAVQGWERDLRTKPIKTPWDGLLSGANSKHSGPVEITVRGGNPALSW